MILPDGYSDVPAGKIAAVVTHLEMTARPAPRPDPAGAWTLRRVDVPALDWYRDLYGRVGRPWLWISRIRMPDAELAAIIQSPLMEIYALAHEGRDEGLLEMDFREARAMRNRLFRGHRKTCRNRRRPLADEPRAGDRMVAAVTRVWLHTCTFDHPCRARLLPALGLRPFRRQVEVVEIRGSMGTVPRDVATACADD